MSHNTYSSGRNGTAGGWPTNVAVTSAEFAWMALGIFEAINGDQGGSWAPASVITIGGAGAAFTTVATSLYGITCSGNSTFGTSATDTFEVLAAATFSAQITATGDVTLNGGTSGAHKHFLIGQYYDTIFGGTLTVNGTATFSAGVNFGASFEVDGNAGFSNLLQVQGTSGAYASFQVAQYATATITPSLRLDGGLRQPVQSVTASATITAGTKWVRGNITAGGFVTLPSTGHPTNAPIEIINASGQTLEVRTPEGTPMILIYGFVPASDLTKPNATVYYDGSSWVALQWYKALGV